MNRGFFLVNSLQSTSPLPSAFPSNRTAECLPLIGGEGNCSYSITRLCPSAPPPARGKGNADDNDGIGSTNRRGETAVISATTDRGQTFLSRVIEHTFGRHSFPRNHSTRSRLQTAKSELVSRRAFHYFLTEIPGPKAPLQNPANDEIWQDFW